MGGLIICQIAWRTWVHKLTSAVVEVEVAEVAVIVEDASTAVRRDTGRAVSLMLSGQSSRYSDILHD